MKIILFCSVLAAPAISFISAAPCDCSDLKHIRPAEQSCLLNQLLHVVSHLVSCGEHRFSPEDYKTLLEATKCGKSKHESSDSRETPKGDREIASSIKPLFPITLPPEFSETGEDVTSDSTSEESTEETTDVDTSESSSSTEEDITIEVTNPTGTAKEISIEITSDSTSDDSTTEDSTSENSDSSTSEDTDTVEIKTTTQENASTIKKEVEIDIKTVVDEPSQPDIRNHKNPISNHKNNCDCGCFPSDAQVFFIPVMSFHNAPGLTPQELKDYLFNKISLPNI